MAVNLYGFVTSWFQFLTQECCSHFFWGPGLASRWSSRASLWGVEPRQSCATLIRGGWKMSVGDLSICIYIYVFFFQSLRLFEGNDLCIYINTYVHTNICTKNTYVRFQDAKWDLHSEARRSWCGDWSTRCALCPRRGAKMRPEFCWNDHFSEHKNCELGIEGFFCFFLKVNLIGKDTTNRDFWVKFFKVSGWRKKIPGSETDSSWAYRCQWWLSGKLNDLAGGSSWMFFLKTSGDGKLFEAKN